jgi:tetratricopeptide (TPR) repeat protein
MDFREYYDRGWGLIREGKYDAAVEAFNAYLEENPDNFSFLGSRAGAWARKGDREKAIEDYTRMISVKPESPDGWNSRGNQYHEMGEYDKAIADYTRCIPLSPANYGTYWSNRGISYSAKGDLDAAIADFNKSIECWDEHESTCWALLHRGIAWRKKGDLDRALADFMLAIENEVEDVVNDEALYQAGYIWFMRGDHDKAIEYFSAAIAAQGGVASYWLSRGVCYWNQCVKNKTGFWDEGGETMGLAEDDFTKAIECSPDMAEAYFNRGVVRCAKARESNNLIKAILTQKVTDDAERIVMMAQLGHIGGKDLIPQADALLRGLRSNRDQADVIMAESFGLCAEHDAGEAIEDLTQAVTLEPDNAEAYYQRGLAYTLLGKKDEARSDYEQTLALAPGHPKAAEKRDELHSAGY